MSSYPFNLLYFLDVIKEIATLKVIRIEQFMVQNKDNRVYQSWITNYWLSSSSMLIQKYREQDMKIEFEENIILFGAIYCFNIWRL